MDIALDLGTANARLRVRDNENAIDQPSVIAYNKDNNTILAVGDEAYEMLGIFKFSNNFFSFFEKFNIYIHFFLCFF